MIRDQLEGATKQVPVEFLDSKYQRQRFLLQLRIVLLC